MSAPTSYAYQWRRDGEVIVGATGETYLVGTADIGGAITCAVTATNAAGAASAISAPPTLVLSGSVAPLVVPALNGSGASLRTVASSERLLLQGCCVWGITDFITANGNTGANCHANRDAACAAMASWGANVLRLRVLADEYTHLQHMGSKGNYLQWVKDWRDAAKAHGIYLLICAWDSLDSTSGWNDANWATAYSKVFPMFTAIHNALKVNGADDPYVIYEPFNEPNNVTWSQWQTAMEATVELFRSNGYEGVLVLDTTNWSHAYSDQYMGMLEVYDAGLAASHQHNLVFSRHDYTNDYDNDWTYVSWVANTGGTASAHVLLETEFGYDNGGVVSDAFCLDETVGFKSQMYRRSNIAGGVAFVFNWMDANSMCDADGTGLTDWGRYVLNWLSGNSARGT